MSLVLHLWPVRKVPRRAFITMSRSLYQGVATSLKPVGDTIKIEKPIDANYDQQVIDFVHDNSYPRPSERKPIGIGHGVFSLTEDVPYFLNERISLVAIDITKDRVVGVAVNSVLTDMKLFDRPSANRGVKAYRSCLKELQMAENVIQRKKEKQGMDLVYLGVEECFERRGLALNLAQKSIQLAKERHLDFIQSITSCPEMLSIYERLKFVILNKVKLMDHWIDEEKAFPNAGPDDFVYLGFKML